MKRLLFFLAVLIIAVLIGIQIKLNPGYVLISTQHTLIEARLWISILALMIIFSVLYFLVRTLKFTGSIPFRWSHWRSREKKLKAAKLTYQGLMDLAKGEWAKAQKQLLKEVSSSPAPLINYLGAAIAAQRDANIEKRDSYLHQAYEAMPKAKLAIALVQGQLQYTDGQYELALATLKEVLRISPRQKQALKLLGKTYEHLNDWHHLSELLPDLQKYQAVDENQFSEMAFVAYYHVFDDVKDEKQLNHLWKQAPSYVREAADIVSLYVRALIRLNEINRADDIIRQYLKRHWDLELVLLFGQLKLENSKKQLTQAEAWLKQHAHDAVLLYILGILAERNQLWGKAKDYYLASLEIKPMPETYAAYAKLLEQQGEVKESLIYYRKGLRQLIEPAAE